MNTLDTAQVYTDMRGFSALRKAARENSPEALHAVAQQFEAMFLNMIFKEMRDGKLAEDVLGGEGEEMYQELHDKQLALHLAKSSNIGIADMLVRQLGPAQGKVAESTTGPSASPRYAPVARESVLDLHV